LIVNITCVLTVSDVRLADHTICDPLGTCLHWQLSD